MVVVEFRYLVSVPEVVMVVDPVVDQVVELVQRSVVDPSMTVRQQDHPVVLKSME